MRLAGWLGALLLATGGEVAAAPPPQAPSPGGEAAAATRAQMALDPEAVAIVRKMSDRFRRARTITFLGRTIMELPVADGTLATFFNEATVAVRRPDGLVAKRSGDLPAFQFAYDGKTMTAFAPDSRRWGTTAAPPTLDAMIFAASEKGNLSFPFDELLVADPFEAITKGATRVSGLGPTIMAGKRHDHVLVVSPGVQLELWIDGSTSLPARVTVVYTDDPLRPHLTAEYREWRLDPKLPASTFTLGKPAGVQEVEFREASGDFRQGGQHAR